MPWLAAALKWLKQLVTAPACWLTVWIGGVVAGILAHCDRLALGAFLIAAPALLLTLFLDMKRYEIPPRPAKLPPDRATRILLARQRRIVKDFARDSDASGHTIH
jgi:hypothetical protein